MIVLGLDTAQGACSAAVLADDGPLAVLSEAMTRGHQERLASMVQDVMAKASLGFDSLDRIVVTVGPGSFTGLRVGLAFAKGLGLALKVPVIGVGSLEALAASVSVADMVLAAIDARRGRRRRPAGISGRALMAPDVLPVETAAARVAELNPMGQVVIVGSGAPLLEGMVAAARLAPLAAPDPVALARLGAAKPVTAPRPLYLRAPDAKLPGGIDPWN